MLKNSNANFFTIFPRGECLLMEHLMRFLTAHRCEGFKSLLKLKLKSWDLKWLESPYFINEEETGGRLVKRGVKVRSLMRSIKCSGRYKYDRIKFLAKYCLTKRYKKYSNVKSTTSKINESSKRMSKCCHFDKAINEINDWCKTWTNQLEFACSLSWALSLQELIKV